MEFYFYKRELQIDLIMQQAEHRLSQPVNIVTIKFSHNKFAERTQAGIFKLCSSPLIQSDIHLTKVFDVRSAGFHSDRLRNATVRPLMVAPTENSQKCLICCDQSPNSFFLPCGNAGICEECGLKILKTSSQCHLCRADVAALVITHFPITNKEKVKKLEKAFYIDKGDECHQQQVEGVLMTPENGDKEVDTNQYQDIEGDLYLANDMVLQEFSVVNKIQCN